MDAICGSLLSVCWLLAVLKSERCRYTSALTSLSPLNCFNCLFGFGSTNAIKFGTTSGSVCLSLFSCAGCPHQGLVKFPLDLP